MTDVRFVIKADGEGATREVERVKNSLNTLPAASRTAQGGLDGLGMSAAQTAQAMRQVPMQITDIATSLASGMPVYMVAIQQGGQLEDAFGGIVPAAKALSSTIAGMVNPFTLAAAAAAAVGLAWYQGQQEAAAYSKSLILSGNAIGMTTGQLEQMASAMATTVGTQGLAASALAEMAGSSAIASRDLQRFTEVAIEWERVTGQSIEDTRKAFEELAGSPLDALIELNKGTNFLTASLFDQVKALQEQGRETDAAELAQRGYASALEERAGKIESNLGIIERSWRSVTGAAKSAWDAMLDIGRESTAADKLARIERDLEAARTRAAGGFGQSVSRGADAQVQALEAQRDAMKETMRLSQRMSDAEAERSRVERAAVAERIKAHKDEEEQAKKSARAAESASKARIRALEAERQAREKLEEIISSALGRDEERQRKEEVEAAEAAIKVWEQEAEARTKAYEAADKQVVSFATLLTNIQLETQYLQMSNREREFATAMRELEVLGVEKGTAAWEAYAKALRGAIGERSVIRAGIESAKKFKTEWTRTADQIGQSLSDALMNGGKSASEYIKGLFRSMVLTPVVNAAVRPMAQAVSGAFGGGGEGGGSSLSSMASMAGSLGSLGSFAATGAMNTIAGTGMMSGLSAAGSLMSGGSIAGGLGMGLGAIAPYAGAAYALYSLLSSGGEKRAGSTYGYSSSDLQYGQGMQGIWSDEVAGMLSGGKTQFIGGPSGGAIGGDATRDAVQATVAGINALFDTLGSTERVDQFWGKLEQSEKGRGGVFSGGRLSSGASFGEASWESGTARTLTTEEAVAAFALDLQQATIQALQAAADIPASVADALAGIDAESLSTEQAAGLLQAVQAIMQVTEAMGVLGVASAAVTTAMIEAAGGVESLASAAASYYQGYYSEGERVGKMAEDLAAQFAGLGLEMPATRDEFRGLVESLDLTSERGQAAYGSLLTLSTAFGTVADYASAAATAAAQAAAEQARAAAELERSGLSAQIDAMVREFGDLAGAMDELERPARTLVDMWRATTDELTALTDGLAQALGQAQASGLDDLRATTIAIGSVGQAIASLDDQILNTRVGRGDASALGALRAEEARLSGDLASSSDPAGVAARLAQITIQRIQLAASLQQQSTQDLYQQEYDGARAVAELEKESRASQIAALREQISGADRLRKLGEDMAGFVGSLQFGSLSALNPMVQQAAAQSEYSRILASARAGDVDAAGGFTRIASDYLSKSQQTYGGATSQYAGIFAAVLADAKGLGVDLAATDEDVPRKQLDTLLAMEAQQIELRQATVDTSAEQISALESIRAALRGREEELVAQQQRQADAMREQITELQKLVAGQEAEIRQRGEAMRQLNDKLDRLVDASESQASTAQLTAAAA